MFFLNAFLVGLGLTLGVEVAIGLTFAALAILGREKK